MPSNLRGARTAGVVSDVLDACPDSVLAVNLGADDIETLVEVASTRDPAEVPRIRVLAEERLLKDVTGDFVVASRAADLVEDGQLEFRVAPDLPRNALLVGSDAVYALVSAGDVVGGLVSEDRPFVAAVNDAYDEAWAEATEFSLRTPPLSRVEATLSESIGPDARADFEGMLQSLGTARGDGDGLDEVTISLLVAAKNRVLLYDVSKWGEDVGIASKATFSRTKTRLEDTGLIDTEKVPIDVGRPRLRLKLADERLQDADAGELASVAQSVLAS
ncbi:MAG: transcriptional regulator TbsP [Halobacteriaceae archaeon]